MKWNYFDPIFSYQESLDDTISPWSGHRYFVYDLIRNIKPVSIVELGVHRGTSFFSMCQAIKDSGYIPETISAIDTWKGDEHSYLYDESVYVDFLKIQKLYYSNLPIKPIRKTFDEALLLFEDDSIDLLHIDGFHTYDAVRHDFETWFSKVKNGGVILFHDIFEYQKDFGVHELWEELKMKHKSISFTHSHGLGVLVKGDSQYASFFADIENLWTRYYANSSQVGVLNYEVKDLKLKAQTALSHVDSMQQKLSLIEREKELLLEQVSFKENEIISFTNNEKLLKDSIVGIKSDLATSENEKRVVLERLMYADKDIAELKNEISKLNSQVVLQEKELSVQAKILSEKDIIVKKQEQIISVIEDNYNKRIKDLEASSEVSLNEKIKTIYYLEGEIFNTETQIEHYKTALSIQEQNIEKQQDEINTMRLSKFWHMRSLYIRVKWALLHPLKFIKKYLNKITDNSVPKKRVTFYISSQGNYFFQEILSIIEGGFLELGYTCLIKNENDTFGGDSGLHVVIAPHEFFFLGNGKTLKDGPWPSNTIIINFEQPGLEWFSLVEECLEKAHSVWDINYESYKILSSKHERVAFLPLGYVSSIEKNNLIINLPKNQCTESLEEVVMSGDFRRKDLKDRPIDICFIGALNDRREQFFVKHAAFFSRYNCYFYFWNRKMPIVPGTNSPMNTETAQGIIQRSKILINIHQGEEPYFEWHRIVNQGIANRSLVLSERNTSSGSFIDGKDFVYTDLENFPETIEYYLHSEHIEKAQNIVNSSYKKFKKEYVLRDILKDALSKT
jgi:hypothetical protein